MPRVSRIRKFIRRLCRCVRALSPPRLILSVVLLLLFILLTSLRGIAGFYTDFLWFESLGYEGIMGADHGFIPKTMAAGYLYTDDGRPPIDGSMPYPDVWTTIAAMAAATGRCQRPRTEARRVWPGAGAV